MKVLYPKPSVHDYSASILSCHLPFYSFVRADETKQMVQLRRFLMQPKMRNIRFFRRGPQFFRGPLFTTTKYLVRSTNYEVYVYVPVLLSGTYSEERTGTGTSYYVLLVLPVRTYLPYVHVLHRGTLLPSLPLSAG